MGRLILSPTLLNKGDDYTRGRFESRPPKARRWQNQAFSVAIFRLEYTGFYATDSGVAWQNRHVRKSALSIANDTAAKV